MRASVGTPRPGSAHNGTFRVLRGIIIKIGTIRNGFGRAYLDFQTILFYYFLRPNLPINIKPCPRRDAYGRDLTPEDGRGPSVVRRPPVPRGTSVYDRTQDPMKLEEIKRRFEFSSDFNEIFDAFEEALRQKVLELDLYRLLFMNPSLSPDELCLFGEKLAKEVTEFAFDIYIWLARVFEATHSMLDNYELTFAYYRKAASVRPDNIDSYLRAADCYEPDLNIPPIARLIEFLKSGTEHVGRPRELYERLVYFYEILGNDEMMEFYRRKTADAGGGEPAGSGVTGPEGNPDA